LDSGKHLAVIGRRLCEPLTGVGRYLQYLLYHWSRQECPFDRIVVYAPGEPQWPSGTIQPPVELRIVPGAVSPLFWESVLLPLRMERFDTLFAAYTLPWTLAHRGVVSNLGIYEARRGDFSALERLRTIPFFRHSARQAQRIIANSESTRGDLIRYLGARPDRTEVIHLGVDHRMRPAEDTAAAELSPAVRQRHHLPPAPFLLFVGKLAKRRNVPLLLEAFAQLRAAHNVPHVLVVIGPDYLDLNVPQRASELSVSDAVFYIPHLPTEDLVEFYQRATAFVLPTEHEGFSMTIPEAMACGAPVIAFPHAALEAGMRDAVLLPDEVSSAGLCRAMWQVIVDGGLRKRLQQASLRCSQSLSWSETAQRTLAVLRQVAVGRPSR
jgi:glycosyltransferase involved in cell wall biosynthesis